MATAPGNYSSAHILTTLGGDLPGGEQWSIGIRTAAAAIQTSGTLGGYASDVGAAFATMGNAGSNGLFRLNPAGFRFTKVVSRHISVEGLTDAQGPEIAFANVGSASGQTCPDQTSIVVTLLTNRPGRTGKGRVYLPLLAPPALTTTGRIQTAIAQSLATNFGVFLNTVNAINYTSPPFGPFPIAVQSRVSGAAPAVVSSVRVGDVLDTQRRRRDALVESYSVGEIAPAA